MRLEEMRESENVEDRTGMGPARGGGLGGPGIRLGGGALILIVIVSLLFGINPLQLLGGIDSAPPATAPSQTGYGPQRAPASVAPPSQEKTLARKVLGDTEDVWGAVFQASGSRYQAPTIVLFDGAVRSACGMASAAVGPFYCPGDRKLYLDTAFFDELARRFRAPGDFAQGYVIAHEVGHHVQNLTGTMQKVDSMRSDRRSGNAASVRLELQADCYAGVWAYYMQKRGLLDPGDVEEGLTAAAAVGDDRIQKQTQGYVVPDSFTHGSAAQRSHWFKVGIANGDPRRCDTFSQLTP
jgi:predicted metalloprotease